MAAHDESGFSRRSLFHRSGLAIASLAVARSSLAKSAEAVASDAATVPTPGPATAKLQIGHATLNPDGAAEVAGIVASGTMPGPEIRVTEGDTVRLQVENEMEDVPTSIHWHGLLLPAAMDGVPGISSFPVAPKRVFVHEFPIRQSGTYWYHSHYQLQEQQGLFGAFVIEPRSEPGRYDQDAVVMLSDWLHSDPAQVVPNLRKQAASPPPATEPNAGAAAMPGMAMPAGGGKTSGADLADVEYDAFLMNGRGSDSPWTLVARPGQRVRLRLVNAGSSTYFRVSLDGHPLEVTHADGLPVEPFEVDSILMGMAECYDVVVKLSDSGSFTLHGVEQDGSGQAIGVLHTPDAKPVPNLAIPKPGPRMLAYSQLRAPEATTLPEGPVRDFRLVLGGDMNRYLWTIDGKVYPDAPPLLIRQGDRVRVDLVNETMMWHPMHLHGHFFRLLGSGGANAPLKHTVNVEPQKSVQIEFSADNPGRWFFHCHNLYHLEAGMAREWEYEV
jgi:FtsP/CotA-like multicopper oxidase with cupredoxin domain